MRYELLIARRLRPGGGGGRSSSASLTVAVVGMVLAIIVMVLAITIVTGFKHKISSKIYNIDAHIKVCNAGYSLASGDNNVDASDIIPAIMSSPVADSIANLALIAEKPAIFKTADNFAGVIYKGCSQQFDWSYIDNCLVEGRLPDLADDADINEIAISRLMASQMGIGIGDRIYTYFIDEKIKVRRSTVVGIYSTDLEEYDQAYVIGNIRAIQNVNGWNSHTGSYIGINTKHTDDIEQVAYSVYTLLADNFSDIHGHPAYYVTDTHSNNVAYFSWLGLLDMNVIVIIVLIAIVSAFTLIAAMLMIVLERINMIGILKAMGASNSEIRRIFIYLTQKLIIKALIIGNVASIGLALLQEHFHFVKLDAQSYYIPYVPVEIDWGVIVLLNVGIIVISYLTLLVPSLAISSIKPSLTVKFE